MISNNICHYKSSACRTVQPAGTTPLPNLSFFYSFFFWQNPSPSLPSPH